MEKTKSINVKGTKQFKIIFLALTLFLSTIAFATIYDPGHPASEVGGTTVGENTFNSSADYAFMTDVGIGTASPANTYQGLAIYGSNPSVRFQSAGASSWNWIEYANLSGSVTYSSGTNQNVPYWGVNVGSGLDNPSISLNENDDVGIGGSFHGGTLSDATLVAKASGDVGIGTASPGAKLHVETATANENSLWAENTNSIGYGPYFKGGNGSRYALQIDSYGGSTLFKVQGDGLVGIGTASPAKTLHVDGQSRFDDPLFIGSAGDAGVMTFDSSKFVVKGASGRNLSLGAGGNDGMIFITEAGNVGIGTTSPGSILEVDTPSGDFSVNPLGASSVSLNSTGALFLDAASGTDVGFSIDGTTGMVLDSSGSVGIGTTSPQAGFKLDVNGSQYVSATAGFDTAYHPIGQDSLVVKNTQTVAGANVSHASIGFIRNYQAGNRRGAAIAAVQTTADTDPTGLAFFVQPSEFSNVPLVEAMRIDDQGNVGIGTTAPNSTLQVGPTTDAPISGRISAVGGDNTYWFMGINTATNPDQNEFFVKDNTAHVLLGNMRPSARLGFAAGGTAEQMTLLSSGNVGIGTTAPGGDLTLSRDGNYEFDSIPNENSTSAYLILENTGNPQNTGGTNWLGEGMGIIWRADTQPRASGTGAITKTVASISSVYECASSSACQGDTGLAFSTYDGYATSGVLTEKMRITDDGKVGIGTTDPGQLLEVNPGSSYGGSPAIKVVSSYADGYDATLTLDNAHTGGREWRLLSTNDARGTIGGGRFAIVDADTDSSAHRFVIDGSTSNVGIGTADPKADLDIQGESLMIGDQHMAEFVFDVTVPASSSKVVNFTFPLSSINHPVNLEVTTIHHHGGAGHGGSWKKAFYAKHLYASNALDDYESAELYRLGDSTYKNRLNAELVSVSAGKVGLNFTNTDGTYSAEGRINVKFLNYQENGVTYG